MNCLSKILIGMLFLLLPSLANAQTDSLLSEMARLRLEVDELRQEINNMKSNVDRVPRLSGFAQCLFDFEMGNKGFSANTFRIRRARLTIDGNINHFISYKLQGDFGTSPALVDAFIKFDLLPEIAIRVGQFKTPFTLENQIGAIDLEMIDYSDEISALAGFHDISTDSGHKVGENIASGRDIGIMLNGGFIHIGEGENKKFDIIEYKIGVFNGNGINCLDKGKAKDIAGQINIHPMLHSVTLSGSLYYGSLYGNDTTNLDRHRWSAGVQYNDGRFVFRSEYIGSTSGRITERSDTSFVTENFKSCGYYAIFGYWFILGKEKMQKLMPAIRFDHLNRDMSNKFGYANYYSIGLTYQPCKSINFKLNYSLIHSKGHNASNTSFNNYTHKAAAIVNFRF